MERDRHTRLLEVYRHGLGTFGCLPKDGRFRIEIYETPGDMRKWLALAKVG